MKTEDYWYALEITADSEASEAVEFALNELDASGTEINNLGKSPTETLVINGYFQIVPEDKTIRAELDEALKIYNFPTDAIRKIDVRRIENADWLSEWKKHWKPTETGKFIVAPAWERIENADKITIRIEPQMAFGTGTHETTRLCLKAIEENYRPGMSFLDVGTGTGILAIAVAKMNRAADAQTPDCRGYDTDADSIAIAKENAVANEADDATDFRVGSISAEDAVYDFVCANITIDVIVPLLPSLLEKTERILNLSGILREQQTLIVENLRARGIENFTVETLGEWISVLIEKPKAQTH